MTRFVSTNDDGRALAEPANAYDGPNDADDDAMG